VTAQNSLPGPESDQEPPAPLAKGNPFGQDREAGSDDLVDAENELLDPVWRDDSGHDEWCDGGVWDGSVMRYHPCSCGMRAETGIYPDGRRAPE
jgi:hypothetical protein